AGNAGNLPPRVMGASATPLIVALVIASFLCHAGRVTAQELPTQPPSPSTGQPTPAAQASAAPAEFIAGAPHVHTIAQGLVTIDGPVVWRVRELGLSSTGAPETAETSFTLQRTGASIVRNELTTRRTRLEPGEGYF